MIEQAYAGTEQTASPDGGDMAALKYSRQREEIKKHLAARRDHPTAEMIYTELKEQDARLSLGTVYRNLSLLTQIGEVRKIQTQEGPDHFDGDISPHYHFVCRQCRQIFDLRVPEIGGRIDEGARQQDFEVEQIQLTAYGLCGTCRGSGA